MRLSTQLLHVSTHGIPDLADNCTGPAIEGHVITSLQQVEVTTLLHTLHCHVVSCCEDGTTALMQVAMLPYVDDAHALVTM